MKPFILILFALILALPLFPASSAWAESEPSTEEVGREEKKELKESFGSPDQVDVLIEKDRRRQSRVVEKPLLTSYFEGKERLQKRFGLGLSVDYSAAYLAASESPAGAEDAAGSGMVRFFGSWDLVGRGTPNSGAFIWKVEHRHAYTDVPASGLGFQLGYVGLFAPPFNDNELRLTNFYWRQRFRDGKATVFAGHLDATDYADVYMMASPWTGFVNFAFSTGTLTMAVPNDAAFGLAAGTMLNDQFFLIGGIVDRNGDPTDPFGSAESFFDEKEYFKSIEIGWTPSQGEIYSHNAHLTYWHADERELAGEAGGWGLNVSYVRTFGKWMPFLRGGYAEDGGSLAQKSVSVGFGYRPLADSDQLGFGVNWAEINEDTWGPGLDDQLTFELFYYWQLTKVFAITPDIQFLVDPALNPEKDSLWVLGLRLRGAF